MLKNPFVHTVDSVLESFTKTSDRLRKLVDRHYEQANQKSFDAEKLRADAEQHRREAMRAKLIATNIDTLIAA